MKALVKHPENFADGALNHIFYGNRKGGYHYKGLAGEKGQIVSIIKEPNANGVYRARVTINGSHTKESSFFPDHWTPQQVIDAIEEAYAGLSKKADSIADYTLKSGISVRIVFDDSCKIESAFPVY